MIGSFADPRLEEFYYVGRGPKSRSIPPAIFGALQRKLDQLNSATSLNDLRAPPSNHLGALKGDLKGKHGIRINVQWRIVFEWRDGEPHEVVLVDYH
ncbi:MAG TPA: type II toxin-antitoxin system RelE/ParE family toxin [Planctomycetota bacterium]|nr:type II toxin-antitoxin system RelE/ParE family toxin [Planctomycetota bacterium]